MSNNQKKDLPLRILSAIKKIVTEDTASLHSPLFIGEEKKLLNLCIDSNYVSSIGQFVNEFEKKICIFTGAKYAIALSNGTSALHIGLLLTGVKKGDEVLVPSMTFIATANAISYCNAIPHFIDINESTLGIDVDKLSEYLKNHTFIKNGKCMNSITGNIISAVVPVHTFGHPIEIDKLLKLSKKYNLKVIEDSAEALGSKYKNQHCGTFGNLGVLSFNGNKIITTGGGGAIITNNRLLAEKIRHFSTQAKISHKWNLEHDYIGYNYRMPNINAALGVAQIDNIEKYLRLKRKLFDMYKNAFKDIDECEIMKEPKDCYSNYWLQTVILKKNVCSELVKILEITNNNNIQTRPSWTPLHKLKMYKKNPKSDLSITNSLSQRILNIPSSSSLLF